MTVLELVKKSRLSQGRQWWWGSLRVLAFLGFVNLCFIGASYSTARAAAEGVARRAGQELLQQLGPAIIGDSQGVLINGQRVFVAAKSTDVPADQVPTVNRTPPSPPMTWNANGIRSPASPAIIDSVGNDENWSSGDWASRNPIPLTCARRRAATGTGCHDSWGGSCAGSSDRPER